MKRDRILLSALLTMITLTTLAYADFPTFIPQCHDSDGGKNWDVQGTCTDITGSYVDSCGRPPYSQNTW